MPELEKEKLIMTEYEKKTIGITPCLKCNEFHAGTTENYKGHLHESRQGVGYVRLLLIGNKVEFCWRCRCEKSATVNVPNEKSEYCADAGCVCHTADRAH